MNLISPSELRDYVLEILDLADESGVYVAPGAIYNTYEVDRVDRDLLAVREIKSRNI